MDVVIDLGTATEVANVLPAVRWFPRANAVMQVSDALSDEQREALLYKTQDSLVKLAHWQPTRLIMLASANTSHYREQLGTTCAQGVANVLLSADEHTCQKAQRKSPETLVLHII